MEVLKVSHSSAPNKVAGAIAGVLSKNEEVEIQAIGAGAVNQAVKAIAIARRFVEVEVGNEKRTGIKFKVAVSMNEGEEKH